MDGEAKAQRNLSKVTYLINGQSWILKPTHVLNDHVYQCGLLASKS